jgi:hypothetical protein
MNLEVLMSSTNEVLSTPESRNKSAEILQKYILARQLLKQIEITQIDAEKRREAALETLLSDKNGYPLYEQIGSLDDEEYGVVVTGSLNALIEEARLEDLDGRLDGIQGELWGILMGRKVTVRAVDPYECPIRRKLHSLSPAFPGIIDGGAVNKFTGVVTGYSARDNILILENRNPLKKIIPPGFNDHRYYETSILDDDGSPLIDITSED